MPVLPQENFITLLKKKEEYCDATNRNINSMGNPVPDSSKFITVRSMQILPNTVALTAVTKHGAKNSLTFHETFFLKFKLQI
jgi:hypothetical protein